LNSASIPFTLVAHEGPQFAGNALVIVSDMEERPQYTPWVAAVWVDPAYRMQGIGGALVDQATTFAFALGINRIYLCATRENRGFYLKRGWVQVEEDIGDSLLTVMIREPVD
jgi:N-acetylglutamate synthase-like GNAT family acetyltransferase